MSRHGSAGSRSCQRYALDHIRSVRLRTLTANRFRPPSALRSSRTKPGAMKRCRCAAPRYGLFVVAAQAQQPRAPGAVETLKHMIDDRHEVVLEPGVEGTADAAFRSVRRRTNPMAAQVSGDVVRVAQSGRSATSAERDTCLRLARRRTRNVRHVPACLRPRGMVRTAAAGDRSPS